MGSALDLILRENDFIAMSEVAMMSKLSLFYESVDSDHCLIKLIQFSYYDLHLVQPANFQNVCIS